MLGKTLAVFALVVALVACPHNVPQDSNTGNDGKTKGAKTVTFENGEGKAKGVVTYPGGDRVDWKLVEIPEGKRGTLDFKLTWTTPRPGLQLAFDVFDEWNTPLVVSKSTSKKRSRSHTRDATLENAKGKYYVRVYAVGRGDAGTYKLTVEFKETAGVVIFDVLKLDINDPPKLAALPETVVECDDSNFDKNNKECRNFCPKFNPPAGWPPCEGKCPKPPTIDEPACWDSMPCPKPADIRVKHCKAIDFPPCPDKNNPDPNNLNCLVPLAPVIGRIVKNEVVGGATQITISAGTGQGIKDKGWTAKVLRGDTGESPLSGGDVNIIRVTGTTTLGSVKLTPDQLKENARVKFSPPPR